jgi:hypothetical protein
MALMMGATSSDRVESAIAGKTPLQDLTAEERAIVKCPPGRDHCRSGPRH